jgi:predicted NUDIX family NTP pyrophosphohydrolase
MPKRSAGLLMYRRSRGTLEVLLVHPGGPLWEKKDLGSWSIPKGEYEAAEEALAAAAREFQEETGLVAGGPYTELTPIRQQGGKLVQAWAFEGDCDAESLKSTTFSLEWPPHSGRRREFPEVDRAGWFSIGKARPKILPAQADLLDELAAKMR